MALTPGSKLGPYEIQSPLGAGGMGEVYRATDTKLGRDIALKVLPAEMAQDPERLGRFRREAKTLAQLDHPNIVTIHSVEECGGIHFLTMQLVDGLPLDRLIPQGGLPVEQIIEIASALGDALAAAHEKGIVHRDLKPANVMVSNEGRVKVLDFGLAKDVRGASLGDATLTSASQTEVGVVMGTPAYMSPEQTSGRPLDHRTDIFSLGVLLHEMATGRRPFEGTSPAELISAILRDTPPSVTDSRPDLPSDLARIVRRCLEKDPRHRLQTARDVSNEFRDMARTSSRPTPVSTAAPRMAVPLDSGAARADEGFWVAVLPFKYAGASAELKALADGLSEEVVTGLSRFSYLRVIARGSTAKYLSESGDLRAIGKELGARYVMEGSLRQAGSKLRLAVQLVEATAGSHLWAEAYERAFTPESVFELQDDLVPRIVATVADRHGVLAHSMSEAVRAKNPTHLTPYEAVLLSFGYAERLTSDEQAAAKACLERSIAQAPGNADAWAMLAMVFCDEYSIGLKPHFSLMDQGLEAAKRAIKAGPSNHMAYNNLAYVHFLRREFGPCRHAAERALALNPMDGSNVWFVGLMLAYMGEWDRGCSLAERAMELNPHYPGKYRYPLVFNLYRKGDYKGALSEALRLNIPDLFYSPLIVAAAAGQLGEDEIAEKAVRDLLALRPDMAVDVRENLGKWFQPGFVEHVVEGLVKAGLEIPPAQGSTVQYASPTTSGLIKKRGSGATRADEGFWVAVLPFKYSGGNAELTALSEGLSEEVITGLSRFSYLRVIARGSTAKYSSESGDVRAIGKELGARYVMEGSLRQAGTKLRLAVQLVDAASGAQMWAETYERDFSAEAIFEVQDELVLLIVSTVADQHGVLPHSLSNLIRNKPDDQLSPYEAVLRVFSFHERMSPEEHASVRALLERAVQKAPSGDDCWAMLATLYADEYMFGFSGEPDPLGRAQKAAERAVELAPSSSLAYQALAQSLFFRREWQAFRPIAERTVALNRADGALNAFIGMLIALAGDWERGCAVVDAAIQLNPHHPGWYWLTAVFNTYRKRDYRASAGVALKINMPGYFWGPATSAAAFGQLGERERAQKAVKELLAIRPDFAATARAEFGKWFDDDLAEHYVEGLRKAGLQIVDSAQASAAVRASDSGSVRADEGFWVAVLPFKYTGDNRDLKALAEGLSEEVITGLSRFSYLRVIARGSIAKYSSESGDIRAIGKELGARYVMEGSLRQAGTKFRLAVQLVDATTGSHVWAETYERAFSPESLFELQDDLVPRIVSTIADAHGILPHTLGEGIRGKNPDELSPYEAVLRGFSYAERISPEEHAIARAALERAVELAPKYAYAWAMLSIIIKDEYESGFNPKPDPLERAFQAARRAVELDSSGHRGHQALALAHFYRREIQAFRTSADRAIALNPMDGCNVAQLGSYIAYAGEWERGCELVERTLRLNPNHPGWYWFPLSTNAYRKGDYHGALSYALKINLPNFLWTHMTLAAAYGQLGQREEAGKAIQELLKLNPHAAQMARPAMQRIFEPELVEHMIDGLRKAGLEIADDPAEPASTKSAASASVRASGATRADEGFWVAVLPFKYGGANAEIKALADGLSEEVITGLSRFSYLRVIARGSTAKYSSESGDVRTIGKELGARYVMEGSLRQAGSKLRLAVQLVDAVSGAHLWAENYERAFSPEAVFELQDDLVPRIVSTAADMNGVLTRDMSEAVRGRAPEQLSPYEAVLRSFGYLQRVTPEELATSLAGLEQAVEKAPNYADAWAMLAYLCVQDYAQGVNLQADALTSGLIAARRAVEASPSNPLAYVSLAQVLFFHKEFQSFRNAAERAVVLNPMDGNSIAFLGELLTYAGDRERGLALAGSAKQLNPNHPGWYWYANFYNAYRQGDYSGARDFALKINLPGQWASHAMLAAACGQLGEREAAAKAIRDLLHLRPNLGQTVCQEFKKWWDPEYVESVIDGLRKAGLEILDDPTKPLPASPASAANTTASGASRTDEGFWVAVLPFKYAGASSELKALADGISEEVVAGLSRFSYLRVITSGSTQRYLDQSPDLRTVGKELGARYVMAGNLRQVGIRLRVAAQLVDAATGAQLWSETYERPFNVETVFELQDDLAARIAATVGDAHGILAHSMSEALRDKAPNQLTPYEAVLRSFGYGYRQTPEEHAAVRDALELAVERAPNNADAWSMLSRLYMDEFAHGTNLRPDALNRMLHAARRAVDAAPSSAMAYGGLAYAMFFRKEFQAFRTAADQSIALNPLNSPTVAGLGALMAYTGEWERGCALVERAMQLNPRHPGWYWIPLYCNAYRKGDYRGAVNFAIKFNLPGFHVMHEALAAAYGQLGEQEKAAESLREIFRLKPDYVTSVLERLEKWFDPEFVSHMLDGLRKAGLNIPEDRKQTLSGPVPAAPSIAVLPFANMSDDKEQDYFSDGLAEEIINLLAQIPGLKVIARTSAFAFRGKEQDIRGIAEALGVSTVLEGSVRRAGSRIRVTAQLINAADGSHLWAERYDRELSDIFAVQDEISAAIAKALRVKLSPEAASQRYTPKLEAYEVYLKGKYLQAKVTPESMERARRCYEQASELDPAFGLAHVGLGYCWVSVAHFGRRSVHECVPAARAEAERALQIDPSLADAHALLGYVAAMYDLDWAAAEKHFDFPMAKLASFETMRPIYSGVQFLRGNVEQAIKLAQHAIEDDPLDVWAHMNLHAYLQAAGRDDEALEQLKKVVELDQNQVVAMVSMAMIHAHKGDMAEALKIARRAYAVGPWFPDTVGVLAGLTRRNGEEIESKSLDKALGSGEALGDARAHALFHLLCGEIDQGADWVERAIAQRDPSMMFYLRFVVSRGLRASHRWPKIAKMINLPVAAQAPSVPPARD